MTKHGEVTKDGAREGAGNRGVPASQGSGEVTGSGSGAGGGGTAEDYDDDSVGGGGSFPKVSGTGGGEKPAR